MKLIYKNNEYYLVKCNNFLKRLKGLSFKKKTDKIYVFYPCNSIHTMFMRFNIDVVITDKKYNILYYKKNINKRKIITPIKHGYYTFEIPSHLNLNLDNEKKLVIKD